MKRSISISGNYLLLVVLALVFKQACLAQFSTYRIDPAQAYGGKVSDYFSEVKYIPLETTRQSIVGNITNLLVTDSSLITSNLTDNTVTFFSSDGKFLSKVKAKTGFRTMVTFDRTKRQILMVMGDPITRKFESFYYTQRGKLIGKIDFPLSSVSKVFSHIELDRDYSVSANNCSPNSNTKKANKDTTFLFTVYERDSIYKFLLPVKRSEMLAMCKLVGGMFYSTAAKSPGRILSALPLSHVVYEITKDTAKPVFKLIFPADRALAPEVINSTNEKFLDSLKRANQWDGHPIMYVTNCYKTDSLIYFLTRTGGAVWSEFSTENERIQNFLYNTKNGKLVALERLMPDESNSYLPFFDWPDFGLNGLRNHGNYFYTIVSPQKLFAARERNGSNVATYPKALEELFKSADKNANPILIRLKLKK